MSELLAVGDDIRAAQDVEIRAEALAMPASGMARPASCTMFRQMSPELDGMSVRRIGELVDRLMADGNRMALQPHPAGDLLRRPAMHDPLDDRLADMREAHKFPELGPALAGHVMRGHAMIAAQLRPFLVDVDVTPDLTENRRAMTSKFLRDDVNAQAGVAPAGDPAPFVQVYVGVGAFDGSVLAADNPLASFASRTSNLNPPSPFCRQHNSQ